MEEIHLGDQTIRFDREKTRAAYATIDYGSPEKCGCQFCRNFAVQRKLIYPQQFRELLDRLGVDAEKEGDVYEGTPSGPLVGYGGWFYLAGEIVEAGERLTMTAPPFEYFFRMSYRPIAVADFGEEVLALEFSTKVPWILAEPPEW